MTELRDIERHEPLVNHFKPLGERLKNISISKIQEKTPRQRCLRFVKKNKRKYCSLSTKFSFLNKRVEAAQTKKEKLPDSTYFHPSESEGGISHEPNFEKGAPESKIERSSHFTMDAHLKDFLSRILHIRIPSVKIYANHASDVLVRKYRADALTYDDNVLFKAGKYDPRGERGISLLGHELTHAAQSRIHNKEVPAQMMTNINETEEREALDNEKRVLRYFSSQEVCIRDNKASNPVPMPHTQPETPKNTALKLPVSHTGYRKPSNFTPTDNQLSHPRTALSSRDLSLPAETNISSNISTELSERQLRLIKDEVYIDIMDRIRIEFERGG